MMLYFLWTITLITAALCVCYTAYMLMYCYGWSRTKTFVATPGKAVPVAVIIAARNEEHNIANCLDAVIAQQYPASDLTVFVVDDHSTDRTNAIVSAYAEKHAHLRLIAMKETGRSGKKNAIAEAIAQSNAELIVTTDADCTMGEEWLSTIVAFYTATNAKMITGPVAFCKEQSVFEKMQCLELSGLMASTAGALYFNKAVLCNGANLAYPRSAFEAVGGFKDIDASASGDDVLLMYKINNNYPAGVKFLKSEAAIVQTSAKATLPEFISQRKRWASKGFAALNGETKRLSLTVYFFSLFLLLSLVITGFAAWRSTAGQPFLNICLILAGIKCIIDFLLLFLAASFFKRRNYLYLFLPEQLLYMAYIVVTGLLGAMKKYEWKGRNY